MIETERLVLRRWRDADRAPFAAMNADPQVMDFPHPLSRSESDAEIDAFEAAWERDGFSFAAIERRSDGRFLGMAGISCCELTPLGSCVELGYRLARAAWGHGYATEAAGAWLRHGLDTLGLPEIVAFTDPAHAASRRVMKKLGMVHDPARDFEHPDVPPGHPLRAHVLYALSRPENRG